MYNYLVEDHLLAIIFILLVIVFVVFLLIKLMQNLGLEKVRAIVYKGFVTAEHE